MSRKRSLTLILASAAIGTLTSLLAPASALAVSPLGHNIGSEVKSWGSGLLLVTAAAVGLSVLGKKESGPVLGIALIVLVLGGFLFAPGAVKAVIEGVWKSVGGG
jgi:hypothetical protein